MLKISALLLATITFAFASIQYDGDKKLYSYICLERNQDLCLGISPGNEEPAWDPSSVYLLQLKQRTRNEAQGLDYKKTRWDVRYRDSFISLSRFPNLCASQPPNPADWDTLGLYQCNTLNATTQRGKWNLQFRNDPNQAGVLNVRGTDLCATIMRCESGGKAFCSKEANTVATSGFETGAYVKLRKCWYADAAAVSFRPSQVFRQALDCAIGCLPYMLNNNVCDTPCANAQCNLDNGKCITASPTPPSVTPTESPTVAPTRNPTTPNPTISPTFRPTNSPTNSPTLQPTRSPTNFPSAAPSQNPTLQPSASPSFSPSAKPTFSPTMLPTTTPTTSPTQPSNSPSKSPTVLATLKVPQPENPDTSADTIIIAVAVGVPLFLLLLLLLLLFLVHRERERRRRQNGWSSPIKVNQAAFDQHNNPDAPTSAICFQLFCCCCARKQQGEARDEEKGGVNDDAITRPTSWKPSLQQQQSSANSFRSSPSKMGYMPSFTSSPVKKERTTLTGV